MERYLARLPFEREKLQRWMGIISKYSFVLGLFIELTIVLLDKSKYIIQYEGLWFRITFLLFGISLVTTKRDLKQWIWFGIFAVMGLISYKATGRNEILRFVVFVWSCYGKDMKKMLKFTFFYTTAGCIIIFLLSVTGIYGEVAKTAIYRTDLGGLNGQVETRYCFGMGHPNAFHCMMLAITWLGIYCYHESIKWYGYSIIGILHVIVFMFTDSKTGLLMSIGTLVIAMVVRYWKSIHEKGAVYIWAMAGIIGTVGFSIFVAKYSVWSPFLVKLDGMLSGRIHSLVDTTNMEGTLHTWSLWSASKNSYFFDLGIVRFFYWYGIIPGIVYFFLQCKLIWSGYRHKDYMLSVVVLLISIYSVFEAHFISDYIGRNYILFFFGMYLTDMISKKNIDNCE